VGLSTGGSWLAVLGNNKPFAIAEIYSANFASTDIPDTDDTDDICDKHRDSQLQQQHQQHKMHE